MTERFLSGLWPVRAAWLAAALLLAMLLAWSGRAQILQAGNERADQAANSLLVLEAKQLSLSHGNYSRVGFYHPGPAILYALAAGEALFHDLLGVVPAAHSAQLLTIALYTAFWIVLALWLWRRLAGGMAPALAGVATLLLCTALVGEPFWLGNWMPHLYYFPFVLALLGLAGLIGGRAEALIPLALASGVLVNGHVAFIPLLGICLLLALTANAAGSRGNPQRWVLHPRFLHEHRRRVVPALALLAAFLLPLAVESLRHPPGPLPSYLRFGEARAPHAWTAAFDFVAVYWGGRSAMAAGLAILVLLALPIATAGGSLRRALAVSLLGAVLATLLYARYGVDNLWESYIGLFHHAVPALLCGVLAGLLIPALATHLGRHGERLLLAPLLATALWLSLRAATVPPSYAVDYDDPEVPALYTAFRQLQGPAPLVLNLNPEGDSVVLWSKTVAVLLHARRRGERLFCIEDNWHPLYSRWARCRPDERDAGQHLTASVGHPLPSAQRFAIGEYAVHDTPHDWQPLMANRLLSVARNPTTFRRSILQEGWGQPDGEFALLDGERGRLRVRMAPDTTALDVMLSAQDATQDVSLQLRVEGQPAGQVTLPADASPQRLRVRLAGVGSAPLSLEIVRGDGAGRIALHAISSGN